MKLYFVGPLSCVSDADADVDVPIDSIIPNKKKFSNFFKKLKKKTFPDNFEPTSKFSFIFIHS